MALDGSQESPRPGADAPSANGFAPFWHQCPPAGVVVRARGATWTVVAATRGTDCVALHVRGIDDDVGVGRTFLEPFERCVVVGAPAGPLRRASRRAWVAALRGEVASVTRVDVPRGLEHAAIEVLPYQLEPAIALRRGEASRLLIADHVGLGKTIQAGIVIADLLARHEGSRVLVVTPAGLREQWEDELRRRFAVRAVVCGARWLASEIGRWPPTVNPWAPPAVRIVSIDFLKRPETLNALDTLTWDLLVVDEAHVASAGSDRGSAAAAVARRSRLVVCTTATPHNGAEAGFKALCALGRHDAEDRIAVFRRSRAALRPGAGRRSIVLRVAVSAAERRMHDLLSAYMRAATAAGPADPGAHLAMAVLVKRALSSARALELTATRRRALLEREPTFEQGSLFVVSPEPDLGDGEVPEAVLARPALRNRAHERAWLGAVIEAARHAARRETKLTVLARLLRRAREPHIVFTEYRDTLLVLARALRAEQVEVLHGGQTAEERRQALAAFGTGQARVLLATDTASEGLNLHARCRSVVLFDLPWTPMRTEQRVGRVDRIGQGRRVHALSLAAAGTADDTLVQRHAARDAAIQEALDGADASDRAWPHLRETASHAAWVVSVVRAMAAARKARAEARVVRGNGSDRCRRAAPLVTTLGLRRPLGGLASGLLLVVSVRIGPAAGSPLEAHVVPLVCALGGPSFPEGRSPRRLARGRLRQLVAALLAQHQRQIERAAEATVAPRLAEVVAGARRHDERCAWRAAAIARDRERALAHALVQPGLFDVAPGAVPRPRDSDHRPADSRLADGDTPRETLSLRTRVALAALFHLHPASDAGAFDASRLSARGATRRRRG